MSNATVLGAAVAAMQTVTAGLNGLVLDIMKEQIAADGWTTAYAVTQRLRQEAEDQGITGTVYHQQVRPSIFAAYHGDGDLENPTGPLAMENGTRTRYFAMHDDGTLTGVTVNPPLVYFSLDNVPAPFVPVLVAADLIADPNAATDPSDPAAAPVASAAYTGLTIVD